MGGGGAQETWASQFNETRFSGELFRSPLIPLIAYGMIFLSIVLVVCFADNNLLDFAMSQHKEAQERHARQIAEAQNKEQEANSAQNLAAGETSGAGSGAEQQAIQQPMMPGFSQAGIGQPMARQQPGQMGYLQQSLAQQASGQPQPQQYAQSAYAPPGYAQPGYGQAPYVMQGGVQQSPYPQTAYSQTGCQQPMSQGGMAPIPARGGAYYQPGFKTGPDINSRIPINRMVVNR